MKNKRVKRRPGTSFPTKKLVFCAIIAALSVIILALGSVTVLDLSAVVLCALATMVVMVECGPGLTWLTIAVTGILALVLLPAKILAVLYIGIGGIYPICKASFEHFRPWVAWLFKLSFLDTMLLAAIGLSRLVFTAEEPFYDFSMIVLLVGTVFFAVFDLVLSMCISVYIVKIRKRLGLKSIF